jgi:hypothetical protein
MMNDSTFVSIINLISRPSDYHGKKVSVIGFAVVQFEGNGLFLSDTDFRVGITKNALWLEIPLTPENRSLSEKFVLVDAVFDATRFGHMGMYSATLADVTRLLVWGPRPTTVE